PVLQAEDDPIDWLAKHLKVEFLGPEILQISLAYDEPDQARILVDAVKDSYLRDIVNRSMTERGERLRRLTEMMASQDAGLKRKRNSLRELAKDPSGTDTERRLFQQQLLQAQIAASRTQLVRVQTDLRAAKLREDVLSADAPLDIPEVTLDRYVDADRRVVESAERLKKAELTFEDFRSRAADPKSGVVTAEA